MAKKSILLIDDDPIFREAISAVLESEYEIRCAENGTEGLRKVDEARPDLILLDVMMDHLSEGFDVARQLRSDEEKKTIPIIMLTGVDEFYNVRMEVDESWVPCDRYLEKPVAPEILLEQVRDVLA